MRKIDLIDQNLNCYDEWQVDFDNQQIDFAWELWFDVDKYFGTHVNDDDSSWVNFYTIYNYNDDRVRAEYYVDEPGSGYREMIYWELTTEEEEFLRKKMEEYCKCGLKELYEKELNNE